MQFINFNELVSAPRLNRYLLATGRNTKKAMTLYRYNLELSQELFTIISIFEVVLRNKIDNCMKNNGYSNDWLYDASQPGGIFFNKKCKNTKDIILDTKKNLKTYSHDNLIAELMLGFWRYLFANHQFMACAGILINIFPSLPPHPAKYAYPNQWIHNDILFKINNLRNRIAHHQPICFDRRPNKYNQKNTYHVLDDYQTILNAFKYMDINDRDLLYGLDHVRKICHKINKL